MSYDAWADNLLTDAEREAFDRDGYFVVKNAMDRAEVDRLNGVVERLRDENRGKGGYGSRDQGAGTLGATDRLNLKDCAVMVRAPADCRPAGPDPGYTAPGSFGRSRSGGFPRMASSPDGHHERS